MAINVARQIAFSPTEQPPVYDATDLTNPDGLAQIKLGDQLYTLRITRAGKLILTK